MAVAFSRAHSRWETGKRRLVGDQMHALSHSFYALLVLGKSEKIAVRVIKNFK